MATQPMVTHGDVEVAFLLWLSQKSGRGFPLAPSSIGPTIGRYGFLGLDSFGLRWHLSTRPGYGIAMPLRNLQVGHARSDWQDLAPVWHVSETGLGN